MAKFSDIPPVKPLGNGVYQTTDIFSFYWAYGENKTHNIVVPKNFRTNFASIPWFLHWFIRPDSDFIIKAALLHDYLYTGLVFDHKGDIITREQSDLIFLLGMYINKAPKIKMVLAYAAVALFGGSCYGQQ